MGFLDKVKSLFSQNADKVDSAIDRGGDFIDDKTGGKFSEHVDKGQDAANDAVDKLTDESP
jgi:hypothetical protein